MAYVRTDRTMETSTTTGTGAFTLAGAVAGFRTFASVCSVADTLHYYIEAVGATGIPTGEWETGFGTYSGANTLSRTLVLESSNAGAAVDFSAGTKRVAIAVITHAGNWTPTVAFATNGDFTPTYTQQHGRYTIQDGMCSWWFYLQWNSNAYTTASGQLQVDGLPIISALDASIGFDPGGSPYFANVTFDAAARWAVIFCEDNTTLLKMWQVQSAGAVIAMDTDNFTASTSGLQIRASGSYRI